MNIEDYKTSVSSETLDKYQSLTNELIFEPRQEETDSTKMLVDNIKNIVKRNIKHKKYFLLFLQTIYLNTYLFSKSLVISPFIKNGDHQKVTNYSYAYDLTIVMFITYTLNLISNTGDINIFNKGYQKYKEKRFVYIYFLVTLLSSIIFAFLGEVSFLRNFTISGDFWKHITLKEIGVFAIIGIPIAYLTLKELVIMIKNKTMRHLFFVYALIACLFGFNLMCLKIYGAENIHYHVHHAIFAGVMSVIFCQWDNIYSLVMHGIYMGVLIEGISFYGLQELYIFMSNNSHNSNYSISFVFSFIYMFLWIVFGLMFYNKIYE